MHQPNPNDLNPGSPAALDAGCKCPVLDNGHGRFAPFPETTTDDGQILPEGWYITDTCPLHGWEPAQ